MLWAPTLLYLYLLWYFLSIFYSLIEALAYFCDCIPSSSVFNLPISYPLRGIIVTLLLLHRLPRTSDLPHGSTWRTTVVIEIFLFLLMAYSILHQLLNLPNAMSRKNLLKNPSSTSGRYTTRNLLAKFSISYETTHLSRKRVARMLEGAVLGQTSGNGYEVAMGRLHRQSRKDCQGSVRGSPGNTEIQH